LRPEKSLEFTLRRNLQGQTAKPGGEGWPGFLLRSRTKHPRRLCVASAATQVGSPAPSPFKRESTWPRPHRIHGPGLFVSAWLGSATRSLCPATARARSFPYYRDRSSLPAAVNPQPGSIRGRKLHYWASPLEAKLCSGQAVALAARFGFQSRRQGRIQPCALRFSPT
jgi:hypothetical protein